MIPNCVVVFIVDLSLFAGLDGFEDFNEAEHLVDVLENQRMVRCEVVEHFKIALANLDLVDD